MSELELQDAILRQSLDILRHAAMGEAEATRLIEELAAELRRLLKSANLSDATRDQLRKVITEAEEIIAATYGKAGEIVDTHALAIVVAEQTVQVMEGIAPGVKLPTPHTLASLTKDVMIDGAPSSSWWAEQARKLGDTKVGQFARAVRQGVINGETTERIVQRVVGRGAEPGILNVARRDARTLVHSSVMTAANQARIASFKANDRMFAGIRWLSTLDTRTCIQCAALDGESWDMDGEKLGETKVAFRMPPAHFGCRCVASPIPRTSALDEVFPGISAQFAAVSQRASANGPVAGSTTFDQFLARMTPEQVDDYLGKQRAALYRAGKITVKDLVSGYGRELTLDQLRAR